MRNWAWLAIGLAMMATVAGAADEKTLQRLTAPPPTATRSLPAGQAARAIKLVRVVVQLKPEPWALVRDGSQAEGDLAVTAAHRLVSWHEGQEEVRTSAFSDMFAEEFRRAGGASANSDSLFSEGSGADLQLAVRVTDMEGRFCRYCEFLPSIRGGRWTGAVILSARWEIYSSLDRKVVATVETSGGFTTPKEGLDGEPDRLINEAFRDNIRRLIASEDFRRVVTTPVRPTLLSSPPPSTVTLAALKTQRTVGEAPKSVAVVFAGDGLGSGFLISDDGLLLTNDHVVAGSKYVKLKWSDGTESLGEVVRTDPRRDVALVKADAKGRLPLALRTDAANQGETVYAIGSPLGEALQNTMTKGIVSATRVQGGQTFLQSDVAVTHGNSGGPLLDDKGQVIGITDWGIGSDSGNLNLNFFIPIGDALRVLGLTAPPAPAPLQAVAAPPARAARKR
jgi:S1-C subfamily serine protease